MQIDFLCRFLFFQCQYINGSPQNTFVPGVVRLACEKGVPIGGDDFKSGQTKLKSVLVDFLVAAGIKPRSIVSYNHLGNNDGKNLSAPAQFRYYVPLIINPGTTYKWLKVSKCDYLFIPEIELRPQIQGDLQK